MAFLAALPLIGPLFGGGAAAAGAVGAGVGAAAGASTLTTLGTVAGLLGTGVSMVGGLAAGQAANDAAKAQAAGLDRAANAERAKGQRASFDERDKAKLLLSRQQALAAASGAGAGMDAPSIVKIMRDTTGQGELNAQMAAWNGETQARGLEDQATAARVSGRATRLGSIYGAIGTGFGGVSQAARGYQGWSQYAS